MKKQVIVIHGGTSFETYKDYISYLKSREISIERLRPRKDWKSTLAPALGSDYDVLMPRMPNSTNARYAEWRLWFNRISEVFNDKDLILIGHSLGGIFLAKYLTENIFPKKIKSTILIAAPYDNSDNLDKRESLKDFNLPPTLEKLANQGGEIYLIHSKDDEVVPFEQLAKYKQALPSAKALVFEDRGHFNQETFPEIIEIIKSI